MTDELIKYEAVGNCVYSVWQMTDGEIRSKLEVEIEHDGTETDMIHANRVAQNNAHLMNAYIEAGKR